MPDDSGLLVKLLSEGGTLVGVVVVCWIFAKFVTRTQDASERREEKLTAALDGIRTEFAGMRVEIAKLTDAVDDFRPRRAVEGG